MPASTKYIASCCFLNVGQGTSQVILLGGSRAIIIDTGIKRDRSKSPLIELLQELHIQTIEALILSHNDADHIGDTKNVFDEFQSNIRNVFLLDDRPSNNNAVSSINEAIEEGYITREQVKRLEMGQNDDIFSEQDLTISVLFPDVLANIQNSKNGTCAVIALAVGSQKIIFSGDAPVDAWRVIVEKNGKFSLQILTVPHHGGSFADTADDMNWFLENVKSEYSIVSVGNNNTYNHPCPNVIKSFVNNNTEVFCTQSTDQCGQTGNCCGTLIADIGVNRTDIKYIDELRKLKLQNPNRLCQ